EVAWYRDNGEERTHVPAQKKPNPWGLYDASGNVAEWVWDWWGEYPTGAVASPAGPESGSWRVFRGGSFASAAEQVRVASRAKGRPDTRSEQIGFRVARTP